MLDRGSAVAPLFPPRIELMRLTLMLSLLLMLAGCSSAPNAADTTAAAPAANAEVATAASCTAAGGEMKPLGRLQRVQCVVPYADAGRTCSAKADCSGQCLAQGEAELVAGAKASGVCQRDVSQNFGCRQRIDNGVAQGTICVD
jgi:putative hemolysin